MTSNMASFDRLVAQLQLSKIGEPNYFKPMKSRLAAIEGLANLGDKRAIKSLLALTEIGDPGLTATIVDALGRIGGPEVVPHLLDILCKNSYGMEAEAAAKALVSLGALAVEPVRARLQNPTLGRGCRQEELTRILGQLPDPRATDLLVDLMERGGLLTCVAAISALGIRGDPQAINPLASWLHDDHKLNSLREIVNDPNHDNLDFTDSIAIALAHFGAQAASVLAAALNSYSQDGRRLAKAAMIEIGLPAAASLRQTFGRLDQRGRLIAIDILGAIGDPDALDLLIPLLKPPDLGVQRHVVKALGLIGDDRAISELVPLLQTLTSEPREEVIEALGVIGGPQVVEALLSVAREKDDQLFESRETILLGLQSLVDPGAAETLDTRLRGTYDWRRRDHFYEVGEPPKKRFRAYPALCDYFRELFRDRDLRVRAYAVKQLARAEGPYALADLRHFAAETSDQQLLGIVLQVIREIENHPDLARFKGKQD